MAQPSGRVPAGAEFDLLTIGRSSIDLYARELERPFEQIESFAAYVGGSPTNIAVAASRLGLRTALLTAVGEDKVGSFILRFLRDEGVDTSFIPSKPQARSSAVVLGMEPEGRFPLVFYRDNAADMQLSIDDVLAAPIERTRAIEISGTGLSREPSRSATFFAAERAKASGATVFMDLDFRADQWHDVRAYGVNVRAVLGRVDVAIGTEEEVKAAMLTDPEQLEVIDQQVSAPEIGGDVEEAIASILALPAGPQVLVVKRGAAGATVHERGGEVVKAGGFPVEVLNVLGAGDAFAGGLIYGHLNGWDWYRSARMGNACGAIVVTRHGCANFMAYEEEALNFIADHGGF